MASNYINVIWSARATRKPANVLHMAQAPIVAGQKSALVQVRVNEDLADGIDELAAKRGTTRSVMVRQALQLLLDQEVAAS